MKILLFTVVQDHTYLYYDDFTTTRLDTNAFAYEWKVEDGKVWWSYMRNEWTVELIEIQQAYQVYLTMLITGRR